MKSFRVITVHSTGEITGDSYSFPDVALKSFCELGLHSGDVAEILFMNADDGMVYKWRDTLRYAVIVVRAFGTKMIFLDSTTEQNARKEYLSQPILGSVEVMLYDIKRNRVIARDSYNDDKENTISG